MERLTGIKPTLCCSGRGGGSATATTAMAVPIVKQKVGVVNDEELKRAWHSIS